MFPMVEMSRLTVAAPLDSMDDVLAACDALGCVHVQPCRRNSRKASASAKPRLRKVAVNC